MIRCVNPCARLYGGAPATERSASNQRRRRHPRDNGAAGHHHTWVTRNPRQARSAIPGWTRNDPAMGGVLHHLIPLVQHYGFTFRRIRTLGGGTLRRTAWTPRARMHHADPAIAIVPSNACTDKDFRWTHALPALGFRGNTASPGIAVTPKGICWFIKHACSISFICTRV